MDGWTNGWTDIMMYRQMGGYIDRINRQTDRRMDRWMDGQMDGWKDR